MFRVSPSAGNAFVDGRSEKHLGLHQIIILNPNRSNTATAFEADTSSNTLKATVNPLDDALRDPES
ncbi:hypothetical protein EDE15_4153 [Edaphobacter aggregans]|uniref:Uncharacterized protein n=1 Tax=Edaphobacter aggregans TaxID=570835 RepID=A0A428MNT2_9BACT|nr:hypothetical protein EDE15_4153 [Edaphobacter aggregans]